MNTILVIDDDVSFRRLITATLRREGYKVLDAKDGAEGLALASTQLPDLILSDVKMSKLDGF